MTTRPLVPVETIQRVLTVVLELMQWSIRLHVDSFQASLTVAAEDPLVNQGILCCYGGQLWRRSPCPFFLGGADLGLDVKAGAASEVLRPRATADGTA